MGQAADSICKLPVAETVKAADYGYPIWVEIFGTLQKVL
jgi:hypothetical protein